MNAMRGPGMRTAVNLLSAMVLDNVRRGRTGDREREDAIALFRCAACLPTCPRCGTILNLLTDGDGHAVDVVAEPGTAKLAERRRLGAVVACPHCEFIEERGVYERDQR